MINRQTPFKKLMTYFLIFFLLLLFIFPIYWMFIGSLKDNSVLMRLPPQFYPTFPQWTAINRFSNPYMRYIGNSLIVASITVAIDLLFSVFVGIRFHVSISGRKAIMTVILSAQVFPTVVILISLYEFFSKFKLMNSYLGLTLADVAMSLPLSVDAEVVLRRYPRSLDEAACVDGCGCSVS